MDNKKVVSSEAARERFKRRLARIVRDARRDGICLVADADAIGVRVLTRAERDGADDLRTVGEVVSFDDACGGGASKVGAGSTSFGVS